VSRFLLCWRRDGDAVPPEFRRAAERSGAAGARWRDERDVLAVHWPSAWAPGAEDALPCAHAGWVGSGTLRVDDREALAARLRDVGQDGPDDDTALIWRAFVAWGADGPRHWIGDAAVAAVAPGRARLVIVRSGAGVRPAFHRSLRGVECVSDDLALLVALGSAPALDERAVVEYLVSGHVTTRTRTFHEGITRLPPWHTQVIERDGTRRTTAHRELPTPPIAHDRGEADTLDGFREVVGAAVRDRLRGPRASVMLSGGLDSTTLAAEARRAAPHVALVGVTFSWHRMLGDDEAAFARIAAGSLGLHAHEVIEHEAHDGLAGAASFVSPEPLPDPEPLLWRSQAARLAVHAPIALLGEDLDALLAPATLFEQLRSDGPGRTVRAWRAYRARTGRLPWIGARRASARRVVPPWLRASTMLASVLASRSPGIDHATRGLAARRLLDPVWDATCWAEDPRMSGSEVVVLLPFMDPRVLAFAFTVPSVPWLQRKALVREAMRGVLPERILTRPKSPLRGYVAARVAAWRRSAAPVSMPPSVEPWVDPVRWQEVLASDDTEAVHVAWRVHELARWLAQPRVASA
jgi:asparagine synthase (glutamine-hydrolysing)